MFNYYINKHKKYLIVFLILLVVLIVFLLPNKEIKKENITKLEFNKKSIDIEDEIKYEKEYVVIKKEVLTTEKIIEKKEESHQVNMQKKERIF